MTIQIVLLNILLIVKEAKDFFPVLTISIITPSFEIGTLQQTQDYDYREIGLNFPINFFIGKGCHSWWFGISFGFGFAVNYQWDY